MWAYYKTVVAAEYSLDFQQRTNNFTLSYDSMYKRPIIFTLSSRKKGTCGAQIAFMSFLNRTVIDN